MKRVRIFGAGVRGRLASELISWQFGTSMRVEGFYDDRYPSLTVGPGGDPVFGRVEMGILDIVNSGCSAFLALGTRASARACELLAELRSLGVDLARLVSPQAFVSPSATIGDNPLVFPGVFIGSGTRIGDLFCAHGGAVVEHDGRIGHNVLIGPASSLAGAVKVGSHSFLGAGCVAIPSITIGRGTFVGAGSVIVRDLPANVVAFGSPAVPRRTVGADDEVPAPDRIESLTQLGFC